MPRTSRPQIGGVEVAGRTTRRKTFQGGSQQMVICLKRLKEPRGIKKGSTIKIRVLLLH
jgi:hypothetical protein